MDVLSLENSWDGLSTRIQEAINWVFRSAIDLTNRNGTETTVTRVDKTGPQMGVMKFSCNSRHQTTLPIANISPLNYLKMVALKDDMCPSDEMTVRIVGSGGYFIDVKYGNYNDGNKLHLWPCNSRCSQQWTLMDDGTIRLAGKWMAASELRSKYTKNLQL